MRSAGSRSPQTHYMFTPILMRTDIPTGKGVELWGPIQLLRLWPCPAVPDISQSCYNFVAVFASHLFHITLLQGASYGCASPQGAEGDAVGSESEEGVTTTFGNPTPPLPYFVSPFSVHFPKKGGFAKRGLRTALANRQNWYRVGIFAYGQVFFAYSWSLLLTENWPGLLYLRLKFGLVFFAYCGN